MTHYGVPQWIDFVRKLASPSDRAAMRKHLAGCPQCRSTVDGLEGLRRVAAADSRLAIPRAVTARAQALFEIEKPRRDWLGGLRKLAAKLVFDSSLELQPAGVRSSAAGVRQMTYQAGDYEVDLRVEPSGAGGAEIVGQISDRRQARANLEGALVQAIAGGKTVGETETNHFGEFVLERPVKPAGILRFAIRQAGCRIDLPINKGKRK